MTKTNIFQDDIPDNFNLVGDLAIDTETMGLNLKRDRLCLVQICDQKNKHCIIQFINTSYNAPNLSNLLKDPNRVKIFHFARFDVAAIKAYLGVNMENIFCTKIASYLARTYTESHSLKELCRELIGIQLSKQQQSSNWSVEILSEEQIAYAIKDVIYLHDIKSKLVSMLEKSGRIGIAHRVFDFINTRVELDAMGWENVDIFTHSLSR